MHDWAAVVSWELAIEESQWSMRGLQALAVAVICDCTCQTAQRYREGLGAPSPDERWAGPWG